jgi:predicted nucleic acid-binding protein
VTSDPRHKAVIDTSVLINFLVIDRADLLVYHPDFNFVVTDHVRDEVTSYYSEQFSRLQSLFDQNAFEQLRVDSPDELETFGRLIANKRLGTGESAAIAAAIHHGWVLAIDDARAIREFLALIPEANVETTQSLMIRLIRKDVLSIQQADQLKSEWETRYRFRLRCRTFAELL